MLVNLLHYADNASRHLRNSRPLIPDASSLPVLSFDSNILGLLEDCLEFVSRSSQVPLWLGLLGLGSGRSGHVDALRAQSIKELASADLCGGLTARSGKASAIGRRHFRRGRICPLGRLLFLSAPKNAPCADACDHASILSQAPEIRSLADLAF